MLAFQTPITVTVNLVPLPMRTYSSRTRSIQADTITDTPASTNKRKLSLLQNSQTNKPAKRAKAGSAKRTETGKREQKSLIQLHFCIDQSIVRKCPVCGLCYTKGAPEDVTLHRSHCSRVQKGMEWSKDEEKEGYGNTLTEIERRVKLRNGKIGRIICFPADVGGKMGSKLSILLETINMYLSSPSLDKSALQASKAYLFLLPHETNQRCEIIAGCVIAQRIETAMAVVSLGTDHPAEPSEFAAKKMDIAGVFCDPKPLPTPMGISRLFVSSSYRRQQVARALLTAAAATFIPGCPLSPQKGQIAFSQPTGDGNKVMQAWGEGQVRIYEDE